MPGENIQDWSTTAASNATADSSIDWAEGMARASVNNSARSMMAAHAKQRNLLNGSITTSGTANAQLFTSGIVYTSVPTGLRVLLKIGAALTNTATATLNMDSIGAVTIKYVSGAELGAGALVAGSYAEFVYNGTNWILLTSQSQTVGPNHGRLQYVSTTALSFLPYGGSSIKINGNILDIPSTGVVGLANTSVYVGGVAAQNLASDTTYYVYAFSNAGVLTADFSTTAHATSTTAGNLGVEIKSGDDTRTLLGIIRTSGTTFADSETGDRLVRSWFNQTRKVMTMSSSGVSSAVVAQGIGTQSKFVCFANEAVQYGLTGYATCGAPVTLASQVWIDGATASNGTLTLASISQANDFANMTNHGSTSSLSEGMHTIQGAAHQSFGFGFTLTAQSYCTIG